MPDVDIYVADTLGELGLIYRLGADRVHGRVARQPRRPESDRGRSGSAPPCCTARMSGISPKSTPRSTPRMAPNTWPTQAALTVQLDAWLANPAARRRWRRPAPNGRAARRRAQAHACRARPLSDAASAGTASRDVMREPASGGEPALAAAAGARSPRSTAPSRPAHAVRRGTPAGVPVICLGNLTVGGAGKTPAALAVAHLLLAAHERPFFPEPRLWRPAAGPVRVDAGGPSAPPMSATSRCCWRGLRRPSSRAIASPAPRFAQSRGASVIVMDDGFQNPSLDKDFSILLVDGRRGIGNGRIIPAGPLRAPLGTPARARAGADRRRCAGRRRRGHRSRRRPRHRRFSTARLEPDRDVLAAHRPDAKCWPSPASAIPEKFFATLAEAGIEIAERAGFPDHHRYTAAEAQDLIARAERQSDAGHHRERFDAAVRRSAACRARRPRHALPVRLVIDEQDAISADGACRRDERRGRSGAIRISR